MPVKLAVFFIVGLIRVQSVESNFLTPNKGGEQNNIESTCAGYLNDFTPSIHISQNLALSYQCQ